MITEIETLDLISQLGQETVVEYLAESETVETIVDDLLAMQGLTPAITKGTISNSIKNLTRSIQSDGDSILRALYRLRDTVGGYIEVDNDRQLNWLDSIGEDKGQQIRYRKNLKGIERDIDYTQLANRIYAYGEGEGDARIKLSDAEGQEEDYIEDAGSQATWGGIYPAVIVDKSITHPDTLLAWAQLKLAERKDPPISYRIDTVDLSQSDEFDFSFETLQLGSTVKVIDEDLGIDVETTVVSIEHPDLLHPQEMILELAYGQKDIADSLAGIYDLQQLGQHIATKIGAGQVIVLGEFTVIDWVSEGTTNIKGDYIRTGVLQSNNWGEDAGSEFNLNDGTFRLGGSAAPALSWNGTELLLEGLYEGEWYDKSGVAIDATKGICIYGTGMALITAATKWGDAQCYVGADGAIYAASGKVKLDADSIHIYGTAEGDYYLAFYNPSDELVGQIGVAASGQFAVVADPNLMINGDDQVYILCTNGNIILDPGAKLELRAGDWIEVEKDMLPNSTDTHNLGSADKQFAKGYFKSRLKIPVGTDCYD